MLPKLSQSQVKEKREETGIFRLLELPKVSLESGWDILGRRSLAFLTDLNIILIFSLILSFWVANSFILSSMAIAAFLLRDSVTPMGSPGKWANGLTLGGEKSFYWKRAKRSVLRNFPLKIFALIEVVAWNSPESGMIHDLPLFFGLLIWLAEGVNVAVGRKMGRRFGDQLAGTLVQGDPSQGPEWILLPISAMFGVLYLGLVILLLR